MLAYRSTDRIEYICEDDLALDRAHAEYNWDQYEKTFDPKFRPVHEGASPTIFTLRRLDRAQFVAMQKYPAEEQAHWAVTFGLCGLRNLKRGGTDVTLKYRRYGELGDGLDKATLDTLFAPDLFNALARAIVLFARLDPLGGSP